jgi:hypothetical protein
MKSSDEIAKRFAKIRSIRDDLCEKEKVWKEAFAARDWVASQIKILHTMCDKSETTVECIKERIEDILCVLDPNKDGSE